VSPATDGGERENVAKAYRSVVRGAASRDTKTEDPFPTWGLPGHSVWHAEDRFSACFNDGHENQNHSPVLHFNTPILITTMRETISISVSEEIKADLDEAVRSEGLSRSDLVRQALREFLFLRRFRALRSEMISHAQSQGIFTDDDVFNTVS